MVNIKCPNKKCEFCKNGICNKEEIEMKISIQQDINLNSWNMIYCKLEDRKY